MRPHLAHVLFGKQILDIAPDAVEAVGAVAHFVFGLLHRPALVDDAVHAGNQAGAVGAVVAMNQHRPFSLLPFNQI